MKTCPLCNIEVPSSGFVLHHTSYNPEETIEICNICHIIIHHPPKNINELKQLKPRLLEFISKNSERYSEDSRRTRDKEINNLKQKLQDNTRSSQGIPKIFRFVDSVMEGHYSEETIDRVKSLFEEFERKKEYRSPV
jgi:hypothetical protein